MAEIVNAQISPTLTGVIFKTKDDFLNLSITNPTKFNGGQSLVIGYEKRNETYYPHISFKVVNPNFWIEEANFTDLVNCTSVGGDEVPDIQCQELNYTKNVSKKLHFTLGFNRDITQEYIEGWDWHKVNLGKEYFFDADFRCRFNTSKGNNLSVGVMANKINTKTNQIDIDVEFNFTGVEAGSVVTCEDPIYSVKKFFDEFTDLSQWSNDAQNDWSASSGLAVAGRGYTTACTVAGSNMSIDYDIDLSDCVAGTGLVNWTQGEIGTMDTDDCLKYTYSSDGGTTWKALTTAFCDDNPKVANGFSIPDVDLTANFRWRFACQTADAAGEGMNVPMFNITCNATTAQVSQCGNLNTGNVQYNLRKDVNSTGTCFNVLANNNTIDCHGYKINYSTSVVGYGVNVTSQNFTIIKSCNIFQSQFITTGSFATYLNIHSYNTNIFNTTIETYSNSGHGVLLQKNASNNSIFNSSINVFGINAVGIYLLSSSSYNKIYNNTINITGDNSKNIQLQSNIFNTTINDNILKMNKSERSLGLRLINNNFNNSFITNILTILILNNSNQYNIFINNTIYGNIILTSNSTDNFFLNNSFNKSKVLFIPRSPDNPVETNNITVKWYLTINVSNSTGQPIPAQVIINDSFSKNIENSTFNLKTIEVTEYTQNGSAEWGQNDSCEPMKVNHNITCFAPFNISINHTEYNPNSTSIDLNRSRLFNIFMGIAGGAPPPADSCTPPASGDWYANAADNCVLTTDKNMQQNIFGCYGTGTFEIKALIYNALRYQFHCLPTIVCRRAGGCFG